MESPLRRAAPPGLRLIETFRWEPGTGFLRLDAHLARLSAGAGALGVHISRRSLDRALALAAGPDALRVRLTLALDGECAVMTAPFLPVPGPWQIAVAGPRLRSDDPWIRLKSTERATYDAVRAALPAGIDEAVLLNERGEVCDGTITSVFADLGDGLVTPPLACGLLPGILRAELIATGAARERILTARELESASLQVGNSLRGLIPAHLVRGKAREA